MCWNYTYLCEHPQVRNEMSLGCAFVENVEHNNLQILKKENVIHQLNEAHLLVKSIEVKSYNFCSSYNTNSLLDTCKHADSYSNLSDTIFCPLTHS